MAPRLPQVSGEALVALLRRLGYQVARQRGSHIQLTKTTASGEHRITVPDHKTIAKGTLNDILSKVSLWAGIPKEDILRQI